MDAQKTHRHHYKSDLYAFVETKFIEANMFKFGPVSSSFVAQENPANKEISLPKFDLSSVAAFFERLKPGYREDMARQKLASMFQLNNEVRNFETGRVYTVFDVTLGTALLIDAQENVEMASWFSNAGHFKAYVADDWDLVTAPKSTPAAVVEWEYAVAAHA